MSAEVEDSSALCFSLRTPYLLQGMTSEVLSTTEHLGIHLKVYAEGGENRMHQHPGQDHAFIVLEGRATFHIGTEDNVHIVGPYEGVMLPQGQLYRFESSGDTNLVMIRTGAMLPGGQRGAFYPDGTQKTNDREPVGTRGARVEAAGQGFGVPVSR